MKEKLGELRYNTATELGEIHINWKNMPDGVVGLDILSDWVEDLKTAYKIEKSKVFPNKGE